MSTQHVMMIGSFDGVHIGHAALIARARRLAADCDHGRIVALVFDPHPITVLRPAQAPASLTSFEQRRELLRSMGVDEVVRLEPTPKLLQLTPAQFIEQLVKKWKPAAIVEGWSFRFGKSRSGDVEQLASLGGRFGFETSIVDPVDTALVDQTIVTASSTMVRWLIAQGRVQDAAIVLGRPYEIVEQVVEGDRRGRQLGFPTANLHASALAPADGVYAGEATTPDGQTLPAAISVGSKPTFGDCAATIEAHLPGWSWPVGNEPEYGWTIRLRFLGWLRDQVRYGSISALVEQIQRDVERAIHARSCDADSLQSVTDNHSKQRTSI